MLRFPRALWLAILFAVALAVPALGANLYCDDQLFVARLDGVLPAPRAGPFALYTLAVGGPAEQSPFWWSSPALRMSFFRPIASALLSMDHALWGRSALPYHLHSVAWFAAAVGLAALLYRKLFSEREAALASLLFAIAPIHAMAANWPAARHVAIAGVCGFAALLLHIRAREQERVPLLGMAFAVLGLCASEAALGALAYVLAYEMLGRDGTPGKKARAVAPYAVLAASYLVLYRALGHGVQASGDYADPMRDPVAFLLHVPRHLGPLACATFFGIPSEASVAFPKLVAPMLLAGAVATGAFVVFLVRALRSMPETNARHVRWLLVGSLLACLPGLGGIVGDRVLFLPSLGVSAALALVLSSVARAVPGERRPFVRRGAFGAMVLFQVVLAPVSFLMQGAAFTRSSRAAAEVVTRSEIPRERGTKVLGIGIGDPLIGMYLQPALVLAGWPGLDVHMLTASLHDHVVRRIDDRSIEIEIVGGTLLESGFETVVRPATSPLRAGDAVTLDGFAIRILSDVRGAPSRFAVTFDRSVSDPTLAFVIWKDGALRRLSPPAVGESVTLRHEIGPVGF